MSVEVRIPPVLRRYTGGAPTVTVAGATVGQVLENLERAFPGIKAQLFDGEGRLHRFINIYRNGEDIRYQYPPRRIAAPEPQPAGPSLRQTRRP